MVSKYGHLMLPGTFPDKITPDIDFTVEVVVNGMFHPQNVPVRDQFFKTFGTSAFTR